MAHARSHAIHDPQRRRNGARNHRSGNHAILADEACVSGGQDKPHHGWFTWFASRAAHWAGKPATFLAALVVILIWAATGPLFGFSDTWQLIINTGTTIITFLMVFLIQNTQNRDTLSLQIKLAELIIAMHGAHNKMATAEDLSDDDLEALHNEYRQRAETTLQSLSRRRAERDEQ
jgi:low affinity Fe/Cu permease